MKNRYRILLRVGILSIITVLMICTLNSFFQPTWLLVNNFHTTRSFYEEPKNRIETLFLGSSVGAYGFSPMDLYRDYGICSYSVSTDAQPIIASYYWLEETYRLHSDTLKNVVLDVSEFRKDANDSSIHKAFDGMKLSLVKIKAALDYGDGDFNKTLSYLLPLTLYHSRWKELEDTDFEKYSYEKVNGTRGFEFTLMTYMSTLSSVDEAGVLTTLLNEHAEPAELLEAPLEYFYKIYNFCKEKGITLTLVKTPTDNWNSNFNRAVQKIADECNLTFLDFNFSPLIDEIGYIHLYDNRESKHLNYFGTRKLMNYIGNYLVENCNATDIRENENYSYMDEQLERYNALYYKQFELSQTTDVVTAMKTALSGNNTVFITVKDDGTNNLTNEQREYFKDIGLEKLSNLAFGNPYIGIIDSTGVLYEATDENNKTLTYETVLPDNTIIELGSGKEKDDQEEKPFVSCIINGTEEARNTRGINIVVYNNDYSEYVYSITFDTYSSPVRKCYLFDFSKIIGDAEAEKEYESNIFFKNILIYSDRTEKINTDARNSYIIENNDIFGFIDKYVDDENTLIFISVKDEAATKLDEKDRSVFKKYSLNELSTLDIRESYIAVIENGTVIHEEKSTEATPISFEKDNYIVKSAGFASGNLSSVIINGTEYSPNIRGINVVVYNKGTDKVIKTAAFDTYSKIIKSSAK